MEEIKIGLWKKESKNGNIYYSGKTTIAGKECYVTMFDNRENKKNEKAPDFNISIKEKVVESKVITEYEANDDDLPF